MLTTHNVRYLSAAKQPHRIRNYVYCKGPPHKRRLRAGRFERGESDHASEFDAFFLANYQLVVATAEYRLSSLADAEEAAAAAFRVACQHHEAGGELSGPWLYQVVRNLIGNEYRRRKRQTALEGRIADLVPASDSDGPTKLSRRSLLGHGSTWRMWGV